MEVLMTITVMTVLAVASIDLVSDSMNETKFEQTRQMLDRIKIAIVGDPSIKENNVRTSFGFVGDMGALPSALTDLTAQGSQTAYSGPTSTNRIGAGWNGPYAQVAIGSADLTKDAWGNALTYTLTSPTLSITSRGSDGATGGTGYAQDITVSIAEAEWRGTVYGYIHTDGIPYASTSTVTLYRASGTGTVSSGTYSATSNGYFTFTNIPFGKRSLTFTVASLPPPSTIGPIVFTMDRKNLELPDSVLDTNP